MKLKYYYQNVRGLRTKTYDFKNSVISNDYDLIVLCETWLNDNIFNNELFGEQYIVYRGDRDLNSTTKKDGGGCIIAVKSNIVSKRLNDFELNCEDIWLSLDAELYLTARYMYR